MNNKNTSKITITNYNTLINFKQSNHNNTLKKLTKTQGSSSNEKSIVNNSMLSTKLNSSESILFKSIYINNNMKFFRMKNLSIKNKLYTSSSGNKNQNIFKKFIKKKFSENLRKIKLKPDLPKLDNFHNYSNNISILKAKTGNANGNEKISYFDKLFRDELFDIHNCNNNQIGNNSHNNATYFKESTKNRLLIRNYLYQKEKKYERDLERNINYKNAIIENSKRINNIFNNVINYKINKVVDYNKFLKNQIKFMKDKDFELYKYIEQLIKEIKDLFINIKIKSDKLWQLFEIRNFLICVKEGISVKQLPLVFRCYNSEYLDELTKLNDNDIYKLGKMNKRKNNLNIFHLPTNLLIYIKSLNGLENVEIDKKFNKYLDPNYKIFNNPDDFIKYYSQIEKKFLDNLRSSLMQKDLNESIKLKLLSKIRDIKKDNQLFKDDFNNVKNYFTKIKTNNDTNIKKKLRLSLSTGDIRARKLESENIKLLKNPEIIKHIEEEKDDKFLKVIRRNNDMEKNQFLYKFHQLKKEKKYITMKEYIYYYIVEINLKFFEKCPKYFYNQEIFDIKIYHENINMIKNRDKFPDFLIRRNIIYLLNIYENAINSFLYDYKSDIKKFLKTNEYYKIRKKEINTKKNFLFKKQKLLDFKIKEMKINKYKRKFNKYRYIQRNSFINSSLTNTHSKGKSFKLKNNNKMIDEQDYNLLLKY